MLKSCTKILSYLIYITCVCESYTYPAKLVFFYLLCFSVGHVSELFPQFLCTVPTALDGREKGLSSLPNPDYVTPPFHRTGQLH